MFDSHVPTHRVLIVDDEFAPRSIEAFALEGTGRYYTIEAGNGADALTILGQEKFDCAVIDLSMPDMSGLELINMIRSHRRDHTLPIVLVLPEDDPERIEHATYTGATRVITKPFQPWDLAQLLDLLTGAVDDSGHILSVESVLRGFPFPAMILDAEHQVLLANGAFYDATQTGVSDQFICCAEEMHEEGEPPTRCPLNECVDTGKPAEETVDTVLGTMRISVYPLAIHAGNGSQLYLHVTQPG